MRFVYTIVMYVLTPVILYRLAWRGLRAKAYFWRWKERFGFFDAPGFSDTIWVHAVSVGEFNAAVPLINALMLRYPDHAFVVTTVTPTGSERVVKMYQERVFHVYLPYDLPAAVGRFLDRVKPRLAVVMETEIWPNLYDACGRREIPLILVSARISPQSVKRYRRFLPLFRETLSHGIVIAAQSESDAERFRSLGAAPERTWVTGNIKFDFETPAVLESRGVALREEYFAGRPVWVAASTHDKEEEEVLSAHHQLLDEMPEALLILVPRHPERFGTVKSLLRKKEINFVSRTDKKPCPVDTSVFLGDTMGELPMFYAASDIAFVGGTLVPIGGHNLLEPASLGLPIVTGPYLFNTQDIANMFSELGAFVEVRNAAELAAALASLFRDGDEAEKMAGKGRQILAENRGALQRLLNLMEPLISKVEEG